AAEGAGGDPGDDGAVGGVADAEPGVGLRGGLPAGGGRGEAEGGGEQGEGGPETHGGGPPRRGAASVKGRGVGAGYGVRRGRVAGPRSASASLRAQACARRGANPGFL